MIRAATLADIRAISDIRTRSWQFTYKGLMADARLDEMDPRASDDRWRVMIDGATPRVQILVTEDGGSVTGFIALEPANADHHGYEGYLSALYVEPETIGRGLGRALFNRGCDWMRGAGYADVLVGDRRQLARDRVLRTHGRGTRAQFHRECHGDGLPEHGYAVDLAKNT